MAVGSFMGKTFKVNDKKIFTPSNLSGSAGADYAIHERAGKRARSQYLGPKLRNYTFDIVLRAQDGVNPLKIKNFFRKKCEKGKADHFIIGGRPLSSHKFKILEVSEEWNSVILGGALIECTITLKIEEYL